MGFIGVYRAIYDYTPAAEGELAISDGDLLFVLDRGDDDWWKAKKRAGSDDEDEPEGLIPANYIEEVCALHSFTRSSSTCREQSSSSRTSASPCIGQN
jgi:hypothetical protein